MKEETDNTGRFSDRVDDYIRYRPAYPAELYDFLFAEGIAETGKSIADIGSGTGIFCEPLLKRGVKIFGVEPNKEMREAAERLLSGYPEFISVNGTAEETTLINASCDALTCAQAFHWFDREKTRAEFSRILKNKGTVCLIWNDRRTDSSDFLKVYEDFLKMFGTDYEKVNHRNIQDTSIFDSFFGAGNWKEKSFFNYQDVDFTGLKGRVQSSSYMPAAGHRDFDYMMYCLKKIFLRYQENGKVRLEYDSRIYYGKLN